MKNMFDEWRGWCYEWVCGERMLTCREVDPPFNDLGRSDGGLGVLGATILPTVHWAGISSRFEVGEFLETHDRPVGTSFGDIGRPGQFRPGGSGLE